MCGRPARRVCLGVLRSWVGPRVGGKIWRMTSKDSTATNGMHHFKSITFGQEGTGVLTARHDVQVELHRHSPSGELEPRQQIGYGVAIVQFEGLAVQQNTHVVTPTVWKRDSILARSRRPTKPRPVTLISLRAAAKQQNPGTTSHTETARRPAA